MRTPWFQVSRGLERVHQDSPPAAVTRSTPPHQRVITTGSSRCNLEQASPFSCLQSTVPTVTSTQLPAGSAGRPAQGGAV